MTYTVTDGVNFVMAQAQVQVQQLPAMIAANPPLRGVGFSSNGGNVAAIDNTNGIHTWQLGLQVNGQVIRITDAREMQALAYSPRATDGFAAAITYQTPHIGHAVAYRYGYGFYRNGAWQSLLSTNERVVSMAYSQDGSRLLVATASQVLIYTTTQDGGIDMQVQPKVIQRANIANEFLNAQFAGGTTDVLVSVREGWNLRWNVTRYTPRQDNGEYQQLAQAAISDTIPRQAIVTMTSAGDLLAVGVGTNNVLLYQLNANRTQYNVAGNMNFADSVTSLALNSSNNRTILAVGFSNGRMAFDSLTNIDPGTTQITPLNLAGTLRHQQRSVTGLAFSPDGNTVASSGVDGQVILWDLIVSPDNSLSWRSRNRPLS